MSLLVGGVVFPSKMVHWMMISPLSLIYKSAFGLVIPCPDLCFLMTSDHQFTK